MASDGKAAAEASPRSQPSSSENWKDRIIFPTLFAGVVGGGAGLISKQRKVVGGAQAAASYAANFAIVTGCFCSARELARDARASEPEDLFNSLIGGFATGALLGRLQGGQLGAIKYSILISAAGTGLDFATLQLKPYFLSCMDTLSRQKIREKYSKSSLWTLPDWSPIQVLDEEALAAKRTREQQLQQRTFTQLSKEEALAAKRAREQQLQQRTFTQLSKEEP